MKIKNSISKKILISMLSSVLILFLLISLFINFSVVPSVLNIEEKEAIKTNTRVERLVRTNEETLDAIASDYGTWDDTRNAVLNKNLLKQYFSINFATSNLDNYKIDFVCLYDNNFKQIYAISRTSGLTNNNFTFNLSEIYTNGINIYYTDFNETAQTITRVAVENITNTNGDYDSKVGYILIGQNLKVIDLANKVSGEQLSIRIVKPEEVKQNGKQAFYHIDKDQIYSYFPLGHLNSGNNLFYIELSQSRQLYLEILKSVNYALFGVYGILSSLVIILGFSLNKMIFKRLIDINKETLEVSLDNPKLIKLDGSEDEIGILRKNLNSMLIRIMEEEKEKNKVEAELRKQNLLWEKFLDSSKDPFWIKDQDGIYVAVNQAYLEDEKVGNEEDIIGKSDFDAFPIQVAREHQRTDDIAKQRGLFESETVSEANKERIYLTKKFPVFDGEKYIGIIGMSRDITELKKKEKELLKREKILRDTTKLQQNLISKNEKKDIYGILMNNILESLSLDKIEISENTEDEFSGKILIKKVAQLEKGEAASIFNEDSSLNNILCNEEIFKDWLIRLRSHEIVAGNSKTLQPEERVIIEKYGIKSFAILPIFVNEKLFGCLSVESLTERNFEDEEIFSLQMAVNTLSLALEKYIILKNLEISNFHDGLTGLYNRKFYEEETKRIFSNKRNYPISIILGDIDGLKMTNDTLGHEKGDELILNATKCLRNVFRKDDVVARVGGDEFSIILPNTSKEQVKNIYNRLMEEMNSINKNLKVPFYMSFGYATQTSPDDVFERVTKEADNLMYSNKLDNEQNSKNNIVESLLMVLVSKDPTTEAHSDRTSIIMEEFAKYLGIEQTKIEKLKLFAKFHDIGKVGISDRIILKPGKLTSEEYSEIKRHCEIGYKITKFVPYLSFAADWILRHHEKWDGTGYPGGLAGDKIPLESRIMALIDSYEAMTSPRPYRTFVKDKNEAIEEIKRCSGTQFDPELAMAFINFLNSSTKF